VNISRSSRISITSKHQATVAAAWGSFFITSSCVLSYSRILIKISLNADINTSRNVFLSANDAAGLPGISTTLARRCRSLALCLDIFHENNKTLTVVAGGFVRW